MGEWLQGLALGLAYVAPIGLQNLFVIHSALSGPKGRAFLTAGIVIFFDVTLALACFFGAGAVMEQWPALRLGVLLVGGGVVMYIGWSLLRAKAADLSEAAPPSSLARTALSACIVTWGNPQALIDGTMMLGAFHASLPAEGQAAFISGVGMASCLWFTGLTAAVSLGRARIHAGLLRRINQVCGAVILVYGARLLAAFWEMW